MIFFLLDVLFIKTNIYLELTKTYRKIADGPLLVRFVVVFVEVHSRKKSILPVDLKENEREAGNLKNEFPCILCSR